MKSERFESSRPKRKRFARLMYQCCDSGDGRCDNRIGSSEKTVRGNVVFAALVFFLLVSVPLERVRNIGSEQTLSLLAATQLLHQVEQQVAVDAGRH